MFNVISMFSGAEGLTWDFIIKVLKYYGQMI